MPRTRSTALIGKWCFSRSLGSIPSFSNCAVTFRIHSTLRNDTMEADSNNTLLPLGVCINFPSMLLILVAVARHIFSMTSPSHHSFIRNAAKETWSKMYQTRYYVPQTSNMKRTESKHLNDSRLVLQLPLPDPLKSGVKSIMNLKFSTSEFSIFYCLPKCGL